ncbi:uncharacterized protein PSANT_07083 [Moesziomyces antarcticus]|uniref:3'-5' exonuclease domain-containing protein n=1 Tax=Pseudozyma antarctica TaxID=84753 RepID=A0A5C3FY85_PSEA2|nr:uncharacterized protein PSANT_06996 [Moesziomyces antarcticus]SPO49309.1 uncharacterized protein PSANT_07001 [Moesziomyces antarcticus]SPO49390.1 uncharacterized protein PSANT_07083 [Moesziomyces antarcticus]
MVVITDLTDIKYVPHLLDHICSHPNELLYLSAKGRGFDQPGGVALLQLIFLDQVFVLDPYAYGKKLFETESSTEPCQTLSFILQDPGRLKVGFDVRSLCNYLHQHFNITLQGVLDLQVYDARRHIQDESPFLAGLNTAVLRSHGRSAPKWIQKKVTERSYKGRRFVDQKGGSSASLYARPLTRSVLFYCSLDAILLPYMMSAFVLAPETMREEVLRASGLRVLDALSAGFSVNAPERKLKEDGYLLPS